MNSDRIDHAVEARSAVATQYTESYKFLSTLQKIAARLQELEDAFLAVRDITDIDTAQGVQLDIIGDIVGVSRVIPDALALPFFGFQDTPNGRVFGEEGLVSIGARFRDEKEEYLSTTNLGDPEYRLAIRAKIVKNHAVGTGDDILRGMEYIFQGESNVIEDTGAMHIKIGIGRLLTQVEKIMIKELDLLPRPAGVQVTVVVSFASANFFGFADQPSAKGFADAPSGGGLFSEEF